MGSSNLTFSGLSGQGELNIDVLDQDACNKLSRWFDDRWNDRWCIDISQELVEIISTSWASEKLIPPYYIYLKMAYHLSREARAGLTEFTIPRSFGNKLFDFQTAAVKIAARHLNQRGGVLIGDVVGLGKTLMATASNSQALFKAVEQIYRFPLREIAKEKLNRQLRSGVQDEQLAELVVNLYEEDKLCLVQEAKETHEPRIICSLGLVSAKEKPHES